MSKKTEANLDRIRELENRLAIWIPSRYGGEHHILMEEAVRMLYDYLEIEYERGNSVPAKFIKRLTTGQLKRLAGLKD